MQSVDHARGFWVLFRGELARTPARLVALLAVAITGFIAWSTLIDDVYFWNNASRALEAATLVTGPLWVGVAAWSGHSDRGTGAQLVRTLSTRSTSTQPLATILAAATYAAGAHLAIAALMVANFIYRGPWGTFPILHLAGPVLVLAFASAFGYVAGRLIPSVAVVPFATIVFYIAFTWLSLRESSLRLLTPSYDQLMIVWYDWKPGLLLRHLALLISATVLLVAAAAMLNNRRRIPLAICVAAAIGTIGTGSLVTANGAAYLDTSSVVPFDYVCVGANPEVCVHPSYADGTLDIAAAVAPFAERLAGTPGQIERFEHRPRGLGSEPSAGATAFFLDSLSSADIDYIVPELVTYLVDIDACIDAYETTVEPNPARLTDIVSAYLVTGQFGIIDTTGLEAENDWLSSLGANDLNAWLAANFNAYRTCQLTGDDLQ